MNYNTWDFALFSANIHHFFPLISWASHKIMYDKWTEYHQPKLIKTNTIWDINMLFPLIEDRPSILCLYHLGYHAQIPTALAHQHIQFDILIDRQVYEKQYDEISEIQSNLIHKNSSYRILFSDDPQVLLKARSTLSQGRHLLIFADGNSGTIKDSMINRVEVNFCGKQIQVRKGIGVLSFLLKAPIIPLTHIKINNTFKIVNGDKINPNEYQKGKDYVFFAMQYLYYFLEQQIKDELYHWESWNYLHELGCFEIGTEKHGLQDSNTIKKSWLLMELNGVRGYFDRSNYCFIYST